MAWNDSTMRYWEFLNGEIERLRDYWPLSIRQLHYAMVKSQFSDNTDAAYRKVIRTIGQARMRGYLNWDAIEDRTRRGIVPDAYDDKDEFVRLSLKYFLTQYRRDLHQSQNRRIELWCEKDALTHIVSAVANEYQLPTYPAKGYGSTSYVRECHDRIRHNAEAGQRTLVLYLGDLDPSGWDMPASMQRKLSDDMELGDLVKIQRVALLPEQATTMGLPYDPSAMKAGDTRRPMFQAMLDDGGYPEDLCVELDSLEPEVLQQLTRDAIEKNLTLVKYESEQQTEAGELGELETMRGAARRVLLTI